MHCTAYFDPTMVLQNCSLRKHQIDSAFARIIIIIIIIIMLPIKPSHACKEGTGTGRHMHANTADDHPPVHTARVTLLMQTP
jgi:hypothetical protein